MPAALFHPLMTRLAPVLLLLGLQVVFLQSLRARTGAPVFAEDSAYAGLAMGERLAADRHYGLAETLELPASRDALWHGVTAVLTRLPGDPVRWVFLLNAGIGVSVLLLLVRLAEHVFHHPPFLYAAGLIVATYPYLLLGTVGGTSMLLTTALVLSALCLHVEGLLNERPVLPCTAALFMALAACIHIEVVLIWGLMFLQVLVVSFRRKEMHPGFCLAQFFTGLLVCAVLLWPLVHYNIKTVHVPWPAPVDAALAFQHHSGSLVPLDAGWRGAAAFQRVAANCSAWFSGDAGWNSFMWVLFFLATGIMVCSAIHEPPDRILLVVPLLALALPVLHGSLSVFMGRAAFEPLFQVLLPINLLFMVLAVFRLPYLLERGLHRLLPDTSFVNVARGIAGFLCATLVVVGVGLTGSTTREYLVRTEIQQEARTAFAAFADAAVWEQERVITDRPGWIGFTFATPVLDLHGRYSPELLYCRSPAGRFNSERFIDLVKQQHLSQAVIWDASFAPHIDLLAAAMGFAAIPKPAYPGGPRVTALTWNGGL